MKIERINENTLKFYISYLDIEDRGFDREEIWYNRDRSEELFWQIMDEAHSQESFSLEGPLWIQVQALEKGMEIIVTRAQISKDGTNLQIPVSTDKHLEIPVRNDSHHDPGEEESDDFNIEGSDAETQEEDSQNLTFIIAFKDIEDIISLSHSLDPLANRTETSLFYYQEVYYLKITFSEELEDDLQDDLLSRMLEYGIDTGITESVLEEYGKKIITEQALETIKAQFPLLT